MPINALNAILRFVPVDETLATAGQPSEDQLRTLAAAGFEVVVNLALNNDPRYSLKDEAETASSLGMAYIHIPVQFSSPGLADLTAFSDAMERAGQRKVFVHCADNKRVPVFLALHRITKQGWDRAAALAAMREVWEPDAIWENFIAQALLDHAG